MRFGFVKFASLIGAVVVTATASQAIVVFNEDFEGLTARYSGTLSTYEYLAGGTFFNTPTLWDVLGNPTNSSGIDIVGTAYASNFFGNFAIDLAGSPGPGGIKADLTGLGSGNYQLKFYLKPAGQSSDLSSFRMVVGSTTFNQSHLTNATGGYYTLDFSGNLGEVEFWSDVTHNGNLFFDNFSVTQAVPEPFTMALGAAGIGLAMRRRLKKSA